MHTLTTLRSTHAIIIQLLHMISLFKAMLLFYKGFFFKKEETKINKVDYKVHLSMSVCVPVLFSRLCLFV